MITAMSFCLSLASVGVSHCEPVDCHVTECTQYETTSQDSGWMELVHFIAGNASGEIFWSHDWDTQDGMMRMFYGARQKQLRNFFSRAFFIYTVPEECVQPMALLSAVSLPIKVKLGIKAAVTSLQDSECE